MRKTVLPFLLCLAVLALTGGLAAMSYDNDATGGSLLRMAGLFLVLGVMSRWWLEGMTGARLNSRLAFIPNQKSAQTPAPIREGRAAN